MSIGLVDRIGKGSQGGIMLGIALGLGGAAIGIGIAVLGAGIGILLSDATIKTDRRDLTT